MINPSDILQGKILIVDDQEANILLLERMLSGAGYVSITSTLDSRQVCELHIKNRYDLILLDLQMPGMDGFQVMEALKEIEPEGYLPVLVITAQPSHKLRAFQAGAKDFISKPLEIAEVLARVNNMLEVRLLHKALREYNDILERRVREQTTLLAMSHSLASRLEIQPDLILNQLHEIIPFTHGGLFALEGSTLVSLAMYGLEQVEQSAPIHIHVNSPEALVVFFNNHQPIRIADIWSDDPQAQLMRSVLDNDAAVLLEGMQSWMWVPLAVQGRLLGGMGLVEISKNLFTDQHAELGLSVADQSAISMSNAELVGQAQALAILEERQHLAHDLHDAVNQSLFAAGLIVEALPQYLDQDLQDARRPIEDLRLLIRGALAEMRTLLAELRPATLTDSSLSDLLQLQGNAFSGRTNVPVALRVTGEFKLPAGVQIAFYRVCQEALNNIAKHANASQVEIDLRLDEALTELLICDDGQGFDTDQAITGHYGLGMMRERAEAVGALLSVISRPDQGTELTISWATTPQPQPLGTSGSRVLS